MGHGVKEKKAYKKVYIFRTFNSIDRYFNLYYFFLYLGLENHPSSGNITLVEIMIRRMIHGGDPEEKNLNFDLEAELLNFILRDLMVDIFSMSQKKHKIPTVEFGRLVNNPHPT